MTFPDIPLPSPAAPDGIWRFTGVRRVPPRRIMTKHDSSRRPGLAPKGPPERTAANRDESRHFPTSPHAGPHAGVSLPYGHGMMYRGMSTTGWEMTEKHSIADARRNLPKPIRAAECGKDPRRRVRQDGGTDPAWRTGGGAGRSPDVRATRHGPTRLRRCVSGLRGSFRSFRTRPQPGRIVRKHPGYAAGTRRPAISRAIPARHEYGIGTAASETRRPRHATPASARRRRRNSGAGPARITFRLRPASAVAAPAGDRTPYRSRGSRALSGVRLRQGRRGPACARTCAAERHRQDAAVHRRTDDCGNRLC